MQKLPATFALCIAVIAAASASAQRATPKNPFRTLDRVMQAAVDDGKVIGHSALGFHDGEEIYFNKWGQRDKEKGLEIERDTIFRIYSMSKPITSVAVMQLVEADKIDLDEPVSTYLPELGDRRVLDGDREVAARREITTRDLLRHTSGLTYGLFGNTPVDQAYRKNGILLIDRNLEQMVEKLGKLPLLHQPGQRFHYSVSTDVLGRLVEVVSEQRFDDYLNEHIFQPLEMNDTFFTVPEDKQDRFAQIYAGEDGDLKAKSAMSSYRFLNANDFDSGGGGLCSTLDDYLQFCKMLLAGGTLNDKQILKKDTIDEMFTNQLAEIDERSRNFKFGLGFRISPRGDYGWGGAAGTRFWVNPEKQTAILYMVQISPYGNRNWGDRFRDAVYNAIK